MGIWISTTENCKWSESTRFTEKTGDVLIIGDPVGKPLYGFGCCISEICVKAIRSLDKQKQEEIFKELFSEDGCGFEFCRLSVGANDFAESWYSYNECEGDYTMENFSVERDYKYIIPAIKQAMEYAPDLTFFASPWSPPTWMKFPKVYNYGRLVMTEENQRAYALYFKKYIEAYKKEGIRIEQLHVQNEIHADQKFPSCVFDGDDLEKFIVDHLYPAVGDSVKIWYGTVNGPEADKNKLYSTRHHQFLAKAMENERFRNAISGASYQWAGKFGITQAAEDYPELNTLNSEMECCDGQNSWQQALYAYEMMHHYFKYGARASVYWNMALVKESISTWGWKQNSLISVGDNDYEYMPDFYVIKHFSHFVKKGAVMLGTRGSASTCATVFQNPDGTRVAVVMNPYDFDKILTVSGNNYKLPPRSFNTMVL